jgi:hypothetical protein
MDVAVFRFTLGIPGFEDRLVPRVVGAVGGALLALNHLLAASPPESQARAEVLGAALALVCVVVPEVEERLRQALPGQGRRTAAGPIAGAASAFHLADGLSDGAKQELAWASFALLRNANACSVLVLRGGRALLARGALGEAAVKAGDGAATLAAVGAETAAKLPACPEAAAVAAGAAGPLHLPDRASMARAGIAGWAFVPAGAESALLAPLPGGGLLLVLSERARGLSAKDRAWAAAMGAKLGAALGGTG